MNLAWATCGWTAESGQPSEKQTTTTTTTKKQGKIELKLKTKRKFLPLQSFLHAIRQDHTTVHIMQNKQHLKGHLSLSDMADTFVSPIVLVEC